MTETLYADSVDMVAKNVAEKSAGLLLREEIGSSNRSADRVISSRKQTTARWLGREARRRTKSCPSWACLLVVVPLNALLENYYVQLRDVLSPVEDLLKMRPDTAFVFLHVLVCAKCGNRSAVSVTPAPPGDDVVAACTVGVGLFGFGLAPTDVLLVVSVPCPWWTNGLRCSTGHRGR